MHFSEKISPQHTALLVIDIQREYFTAGGIVDRLGHDYRSLREIIAPLETFVACARDHLKVVVFTRDLSYPYLRSAVLQEHYQRAGMMRPHDPRMEDFYRILPAESDIVLPKHRYSALKATPLNDILAANGIRTLILTGVATNVCVESTARDAFMMNYHVVVPRDLTAGVNARACRMSLENIHQFFGEVVDSGHIRTSWEQNP